MIAFDSRTVKPKLWHLLAAGIAAAAAVALCLWLVPSETAGVLAAEGILLAFLVLTAVCLAVALRRQLEYNPYSYNTVYYIGFLLLCLTVFVTVSVLLVRAAVSPGTYGTRAVLLPALLRSAVNHIYVTSPFLLLFAGGLLISNISLIRHEGRRLVNVLGMILAFLLAGGLVLLFVLNGTGTGDLPPWRLFAGAVFAAVFLYYECMLFGVVAAGLMAARWEPPMDRDYLIILGCGIRDDGTPTPLLRGRADLALDFAARQEAAGGPKPVFVCSGGQGPGEVISEAECLGNYLQSRGIPRERILLEDRSTDTLENMRFSKEKIEARGGGAVGFATTNYHVFRSGLLSRRVKMKSIGMGAPTKWYFWPNAAVREFVGLLTAHRLKQALILTGILVLYGILAVLAF